LRGLCRPEIQAPLPRRPTEFTLQHHPFNLKVVLHPLDSGLPLVLHEEPVRLFITCVLTPLVPDVIDDVSLQDLKNGGIESFFRSINPTAGFARFWPSRNVRAEKKARKRMNLLAAIWFAWI
jgi:hypothetical protein